MPVYEYLCDACGDFTELRPMSEYQAPQPCPDCGRPAPRVLLTAPHFSGLARESRLAHATNEQARHAPMSVDGYKEKQDRARHGAGCSCCSGMKSRSRKSRTATTASGAKSFPSARPWMISH
ncbi:FmdB family zinc ribbon protein [Ancylobacter amanitiformis]|uniref:FmdB family regulatory protein n=1 Tax=Ancylobacter amanitiformis TaxID=217069 RepID=A0ABU0LLR7_9HYPH|nr:zinc ribbon domain-containing protein [Ancylobacter amanitiformis]MDQ0509646.1 putative FmdB family regulatory protein [Ancylobacter amanitiformis]